MKAGKSWSLRDVDDQTRATLLKAAEKSGLSVNDWLGSRPDTEAGPSQPQMMAAIPAGAPAAPSPDYASEDDPSQEVRDAISRLTARLSTMDERARASVKGLPARLAEIENRLAFLVEARQSPDERARALNDASTMIDALVRDIDGAALRASAFGPKPESAQAPASPAEAAAPPRLVAPASNPAQPPAATMSAAAEQLADIRYQLDALLSDEPVQPNEPPPRAASKSSAETALRGPEPRTDEAKPQAATPQVPQPMADVSGAADQLRRLEIQIGEIMTRLPAKKDAELAAAIREISSRQKTIDERAETVAVRRDQRALGDAVAALHREVASLGQRVATISLPSVGDDPAIAGLARRIDALAADRPGDRTILHSIRADLDHLKSAAADRSVHTAIGDLHERYADVARRVDDVAAKVPEASRIDALSEEIAGVRRALEADRGGNHERLEQRLAEIAQSVSDMAAQPESAPTVSVDLTKLEQRFDSLAKTVAIALSRTPVASGAAPDADAISGRLDEIASGIGNLIRQNVGARTESPTVAALEGRLSQMAANINGLIDREATGEPSPVIDRIESRLDAIAQSVDGLFMGMPPSETNAILRHVDDRLDKFTTGGAGVSGPPAATLARLETRLERIAADLEHFGMPQAGSGNEEGINRRLDQIAESLYDLGRNVPSTVEIETLHARLAGIADRIEQVNVPQNTLQSDLDDIRTEVSSIRAVHQRLQTLTERIDSIAAVQHQPLLAIAEIKDGIGAIRAMHERIQTITDRLDRLSAAQRDPMPPEQVKAGFAAIRSMQERLEAMSDQLDRSHAADASDAAIAEMQSAIAAIAAVHQEMRSLSERISGMAIQRAPTAVLEDIKKDIVAIRSEIADRGRGGSTEPLEKLVADLARQVATVSRAPSDAAGITDLANRVTALAGELEEAKPRVQRLEEIEARMGRLQASLSDTRSESIEAAKTEARAVVQDLSRMVATGEVDASVIGALVQDIENLKNTGGDSDRRIRNKLDALNVTLAQVVSRLTQLEGEAMRRSGEPSARGLPAIADWTSEVPEAPESSLEPGPAEPTVAEDPRERRSDFIAAARRAAQAAAAEADKPRGEGDDGKSGKPGPLARFSQAILNRKRTLLLAAAAVVLAVGALQIFAGRLGSGEATRIAAANPQSRSSAAVDFALAAPLKPKGLPAPAAAPAPAPAPTQIAAASVSSPAATPVSIIDNAPLLVAPATAGTTVAFGDPVYPVATAPAAAATPDATTTASVGPAVASVATATAVATSGDPKTVAPTYPLLDAAIGSSKLTNAALAGDAGAEFEVGARYASGDRVARNAAKAAEWYQRAADSGLAVAQFRLGSLYERGDGVAQNLPTALSWYQRAADQGNINAMHNLAVLLSQGVNGPADPKTALKWFQAAANYGLRDSQYNLGVIYARGMGTIINLPEAYKWFAIAARGGDTDAGARRDEVAASMSASEIAQATQMVSSWKARQPVASANTVTPPAGGWDSDIVAAADQQALVKTIQTLLADQGFDPGPADGKSGPKTVKAAKDYQHKIGVPETGTLDGTLLASLNANGR